MLTIPVLGRLIHEKWHACEATLDYIVSSSELQSEMLAHRHKAHNRKTVAGEEAGLGGGPAPCVIPFHYIL